MALDWMDDLLALPPLAPLGAGPGQDSQTANERYDSGECLRGQLVYALRQW